MFTAEQKPLNFEHCCGSAMPCISWDYGGVIALPIHSVSFVQGFFNGMPYPVPPYYAVHAWTVALFAEALCSLTYDNHYLRHLSLTSQQSRETTARGKELLTNWMIVRQHDRGLIFK